MRRLLFSAAVVALLVPFSASLHAESPSFDDPRMVVPRPTTRSAAPVAPAAAATATAPSSLSPDYVTTPLAPSAVGVQADAAPAPAPVAASPKKKAVASEDAYVSESKLLVGIPDGLYLGAGGGYRTFNQDKLTVSGVTSSPEASGYTGKLEAGYTYKVPQYKTSTPFFKIEASANESRMDYDFKGQPKGVGLVGFDTQNKKDAARESFYTGDIKVGVDHKLSDTASLAGSVGVGVFYNYGHDTTNISQFGYSVASSEDQLGDTSINFTYIPVHLTLTNDVGDDWGLLTEVGYQYVMAGQARREFNSTRGTGYESLSAGGSTLNDLKHQINNGYGLNGQLLFRRKLDFGTVAGSEIRFGPYVQYWSIDDISNDDMETEGGSVLRSNVAFPKFEFLETGVKVEYQF
jgi:hypothetical protein